MQDDNETGCVATVPGYWTDQQNKSSVNDETMDERGESSKRTCGGTGLHSLESDEVALSYRTHFLDKVSDKT